MKNTFTRWMTIGALATTMSAAAFAQTAKTCDSNNTSSDGAGSGMNAATSSADDQVYILVPVPSAMAQQAIRELQQQNQQLPQSDQELEQDNQMLHQELQQQNQEKQQEQREIQQEDKAWRHSLLGIYG